MTHDHQSLLSETIGDNVLARESKLHSYGRSFNGFDANLLPHEAKQLQQKEGVLSVFPNTIRKLHTTRSWDFLGMPLEKTKRNLKVESDMIIGVLDTGIWPESPSFNDKGYGPPPLKWKGKCVMGANFTGCNNKVIGAQYSYIATKPDPNLSALDKEGHGTHTASIAAGVPVLSASVYGIGKGIARGGVDSARIAAYKVCWGSGCSDMDLLAGFDMAIADGVDVITASIGGYARKFFEDTMAIGAFHAMKKGIFTACSGGNEGPYQVMVQNIAPWITTVAASSTDRQFVADVKLGNGENIMGIAVNAFSSKKKSFPLISGTLAANASQLYTNARERLYIVWEKNAQDQTLYDKNVAGLIVSRDKDYDVPSSFLIPGSTVSLEEGKSIDYYINSTKMSVAVIHKSRSVKMADAPFVASFSSRGPQLINPNILKPDIAAPGLGILAAYSKLSSMTGHPFYDKRFVDYHIASGTSMACPHVAAAAAYVKSFHPTWSPAAIKSALMTTGKLGCPLEVWVDLKVGHTYETEPKRHGVGIRFGSNKPDQSKKPWSVYDINISAYIRHLCKVGYNSTTLGILIGGKKQYDCNSFKPAKGVDGLNYPSMHLQVESNATTFSAVFKRIVKNIGNVNATYNAEVVSPIGLSIKVDPSTLRFEQLNQKKSFTIFLEGKFVQNDISLLSASLTWKDLKHSVVSPIVVYRYIPPLW
ncbi:subtilisin-like serine endopeptidase family protein [Artemisia annua]|uniref:Subtilisin-like serine endopeptidase family protein n=1 Tax=Artemisia annua TaxID=35608 RepID=A0A2U1MNS0_ARTAN|nr:subtilisin-like serine endopeptidase family protein [Artemisia annua]